MGEGGGVMGEGRGPRFAATTSAPLQLGLSERAAITGEFGGACLWCGANADGGARGMRFPGARRNPRSRSQSGASESGSVDTLRASTGARRAWGSGRLKLEAYENLDLRPPLGCGHLCCRTL